MGFSCDPGPACRGHGCALHQWQVLWLPRAVLDAVFLQPRCALALECVCVGGGGLEHSLAFPSSSFSLDTLEAFVLCSVVLKQDASQLLITYIPGKNTAMGGSVFMVVLYAFYRNAFYFLI